MIDDQEEGFRVAQFEKASEQCVSAPQIVDQLFQSILGSGDGPFRIMDKVGLDVVLDIEEHYAAVRPGIPAEPRQLLKRYVEQGHLGIKSGKGFYSDYEEKAPTR